MQLGTYYIGLEAAEPWLKCQIRKSNLQWPEGQGSMQLLAHQLAPIYNTSIKCYSYASRRENVHKCHNCICIVVVLPSRGSKLEIHLPKGCPCLCRCLEGQEPSFLSIGLHLFAGNLMQVLMMHFFRALLYSIGVARRGPDSWGWARGCMPP